MKTIMTILMALSSVSAFANINCNSLSSNDSVVLCKQNKRILRKLNNMDMGGSNLKVCTVTYCSTEGKVETTTQYTKHCKSYDGTYWKYKDHLVEARNEAHAAQVFSTLDLTKTDENLPMSNVFISATCN